MVADTDSENRSVEVCDLATMEWHQEQTFGSGFPVFGKGGFSAVVGRSLYIFGGLDDEDYRNELYGLNLEDFTWKQLSKLDAPSARSYGGMVAHGECVIVFGGLGKERLEPSFKGAEVIKDEKFVGEFTSEWNNSLHEYNTVTGNILIHSPPFLSYLLSSSFSPHCLNSSSHFHFLSPLSSSPIISSFLVSVDKWRELGCTGSRPPPLERFSFDKIDSHRALLFGGKRGLFTEGSRDIYILDLETMVVR